jgi:hypothetical protein
MNFNPKIALITSISMIVSASVLAFYFVNLPHSQNNQNASPRPPLPKAHPLIASNSVVAANEDASDSTESAQETDDPDHGQLDQTLLEKYQNMLDELGDPSKLDPPISPALDITAYHLAFRAWLLGQEDLDALLPLFATTDYNLRINAVRGFTAALIWVGSETDYEGVAELFASLTLDQKQALSSALVEGLYHDTPDQFDLLIPHALGYMPETSEITLPHLVWYSKFAPEPNDRKVTMELVGAYDENGEQSRQLYRHAFFDPSAEVRIFAFQLYVDQTIGKFTNSSHESFP